MQTPEAVGRKLTHVYRRLRREEGTGSAKRLPTSKRPWAAQGRFLNVTQLRVPTSKMGSRGDYPAGSRALLQTRPGLSPSPSPSLYCRSLPPPGPSISSEEPSGEMHVLKGGNTGGRSQSQAAV